jgi:hypothetical protein
MLSSSLFISKIAVLKCLMGHFRSERANILRAYNETVLHYSDVSRWGCIIYIYGMH